MSRKIIDKKKFSWDDKDSFRLNYQMIFDEKVKSDKNFPDYKEILKSRDDEWSRKLDAEQKEAFNNGLTQGREEGYKIARAEIDKKLGGLEHEFKTAQAEWREHQQLLKPGLLNLVFDISEAILGMPVTNGTMRNRLEEELSTLFQQLDKKTRPVLWVSAEDFEFIESLEKQYADSTGVVVRISERCNPGEYQLETNREKVVRDFRQMLHDFKESLILPK